MFIVERFTRPQRFGHFFVWWCLLIPLVTMIALMIAASFVDLLLFDYAVLLSYTLGYLPLSAVFLYKKADDLAEKWQAYRAHMSGLGGVVKSIAKWGVLYSYVIFAMSGVVLGGFALCAMIAKFMRLGYLMLFM